jgi:CDI immunity protein
MSDVEKTAWADAKMNKDFISVKTFSGYRSSQADPQGVEHVFSTDATDEELGLAVLDALAHSRFVLPEPREDVWIHPEATFDMALYDYKLTNQRYEQWISVILKRFGYKTKRALFKDMKKCSIESKNDQITIRPSHHEKLEAWSSKGINESSYVTICSSSSPADIGAALRLAFAKCT